MVSGVYKITCLVNSKLYIGSSKDVFKRFKTHINHLNKNKHINPYLQNAWNLYKESNFRFEVIEFCEIENLLQKEQYWMDKTECYNKDKGFNNCIKSDRPLGYKHTEECKKKMSIIKKQQIKEGLVTLPVNKNFKPHSEETKEKIRLTKLGDKNPMFGKKEDEEHKKTRMKNMLDKPRWNKGLTAKNDERLKKLGDHKRNKLALNAIPHVLYDLELGIKWEEPSLKHLSMVCPLALSTLVRLKRGVCGIKITKKYKLQW